MFLKYIKEAFEEYEVCRNSLKNNCDVYYLISKNDYFLNRTYHDQISEQKVSKNLKAIPKGVDKNMKFYLSIYDKGECIGVLDLIKNYPHENNVYIGLFILAKTHHNRGLGTLFYNKLEKAIINSGHSSISLSCYKNNEKGYNFWIKKGYVKTREVEQTIDDKKVSIIHLSKKVSKNKM